MKLMCQGESDAGNGWMYTIEKPHYSKVMSKYNESQKHKQYCRYVCIRQPLHFSEAFWLV